MNNFSISLKNFIRTKLFFFIILSLVVFLLYGKSINYEFVGPDERILIEQNIDKLSNIKNIPYFFTTSCYLNKTSMYYRPILTMSFAIEASLFGLNTKIYHFSNIILFILAIYLMFVLLLKINLDTILTKCICLLIAVHPVFSSTVVWVPSRNDTLLAIFIFLSFIFFINYLNKKTLKDLFLCIVFFSISLFTKESVVFFVFLYLIFPYCFDYKMTKKELIKFSLYIILILIFYFFVRSFAVPSASIKSYFKNLDQFFITLICGTSIHLKNLFIPVNITILLHNISMSFFQICFDILFVFVLFIILYKKIVNWKILFFSLSWFILSLVPTFFLLKEYVFFNHRLFVAVFSIVIILILTMDFIIKKYSKYKNYFVLIFVLLFISFSFISYYIVADKYKNKEDYWALAYEEAPTWHIVSYEIALIYLENGNYEKYREYMFQAYNLSMGDIHIFNIIPILIKEGQIDKVKEICFNILKDDEAKLFHKIGANNTLGNIYLEEKNLSEAYKYLKTALELDKTDVDLRNKVEKLKEELNEK